MRTFAILVFVQNASLCVVNYYGGYKIYITLYKKLDLILNKVSRHFWHLNNLGNSLLLSSYLLTTWQVLEPKHIIKKRKHRGWYKARFQRNKGRSTSDPVRRILICSYLLHDSVYSAFLYIRDFEIFRELG